MVTSQGPALLFHLLQPLLLNLTNALNLIKQPQSAALGTKPLPDSNGSLYVDELDRVISSFISQECRLVGNTTLLSILHALMSQLVSLHRTAIAPDDSKCGVINRTFLAQAQKDLEGLAVKVGFTCPSLHTFLCISVR